MAKSKKTKGGGQPGDAGSTDGGGDKKIDSYTYYTPSSQAVKKNDGGGAVLVTDLEAKWNRWVAKAKDACSLPALSVKAARIIGLVLTVATVAVGAFSSVLYAGYAAEDWNGPFIPHERNQIVGVALGAAALAAFGLFGGLGAALNSRTLLYAGIAAGACAAGSLSPRWPHSTLEVLNLVFLALTVMTSTVYVVHAEAVEQAVRDGTIDRTTLKCASISLVAVGKMRKAGLLAVFALIVAAFVAAVMAALLVPLDESPEVLLFHTEFTTMGVAAASMIGGAVGVVALLVNSRTVLHFAFALTLATAGGASSAAMHAISVWAPYKYESSGIPSGFSSKSPAHCSRSPAVVSSCDDQANFQLVIIVVLYIISVLAGVVSVIVRSLSEALQAGNNLHFEDAAIMKAHDEWVESLALREASLKAASSAPTYVEAANARSSSSSRTSATSATSATSGSYSSSSISEEQEEASSKKSSKSSSKKSSKSSSKKASKSSSKKSSKKTYTSATTDDESDGTGTYTGTYTDATTEADDETAVEAEGRWSEEEGNTVDDVPYISPKDSFVVCCCLGKPSMRFFQVRALVLLAIQVGLVCVVFAHGGQMSNDVPARNAGHKTAAFQIGAIGAVGVLLGVYAAVVLSTGFLTLHAFASLAALPLVLLQTAYYYTFLRASATVPLLGYQEDHVVVGTIVYALALFVFPLAAWTSIDLAEVIQDNAAAAKYREQLDTKPKLSFIVTSQPSFAAAAGPRASSSTASTSSVSTSTYSMSSLDYSFPDADDSVVDFHRKFGQSNYAVLVDETAGVEYTRADVDL